MINEQQLPTWHECCCWPYDTDLSWHAFCALKSPQITTGVHCQAWEIRHLSGGQCPRVQWRVQPSDLFKCPATHERHNWQWTVSLSADFQLSQAAVSRSCENTVCATHKLSVGVQTASQILTTKAWHVPAQRCLWQKSHTKQAGHLLVGGSPQC